MTKLSFSTLCQFEYLNNWKVLHRARRTSWKKWGFLLISLNPFLLFVLPLPEFSLTFLYILSLCCNIFPSKDVLGEIYRAIIIFIISSRSWWGRRGKKCTILFYFFFSFHSLPSFTLSSSLAHELKKKIYFSHSYLDSPDYTRCYKLTRFLFFYVARKFSHTRMMRHVR